MRVGKTSVFLLLGIVLSLPGFPQSQKLPYRAEVGPMWGLTVTVYAHDIKANGKKIACWSYVSEGFEPWGQHEIVFTLRRPSGKAEGDFPTEIFDMFLGLHALARAGHPVTARDFTVFKPDAPFFGRKGKWGLIYIPAEIFPGVEVPFEALAAVLIKDDEVEIVKKALGYRIASMLGSAYRYYPCPPWSDPDRKPVASAKDFEKSVLAKFKFNPTPGLMIRMSSGAGPEKEIILRFEMSELPKINALLAAYPNEAGLSLLIDPDPKATMRSFWLPGSSNNNIITAAAPGPWVTGGFLFLVASEEVKESGFMFEDGFLLNLSLATWNKLKASVAAAEPTAIPLAEKGLTLEVEFQRSFPFDELAEVPYQTVAVADCQSYIELKKRVPDVGSVESYIKALSKAARAALEDSKQQDACGVLIAVGVKPGKKSKVWCEAVDGSLSEETLKKLGAVLEKVPTVEVKDGPIAFVLKGVLWKRKVKEFPIYPSLWKKAIAEAGGSLIVPDELFKIIWAD